MLSCTSKSNWNHLTPFFYKQRNLALHPTGTSPKTFNCTKRVGQHATRFKNGICNWGNTFFSLVSNYIVSKRLSHEGKATVTQLQIHKIKSKNTSLLALLFVLNTVVALFSLLSFSCCFLYKIYFFLHKVTHCGLALPMYEWM